MDLSQQSRLISVDTPLGPDVLVLTGFQGEEEISRLFAYRLEMVSQAETLDPNEIVGKAISFSVNLGGEERRFFNGHVARFSAGGIGPGGLRKATADVVPWLWFLTRTADCRIFQEKTVPEIIELVFADCPSAKFEKKLEGQYAKREYCVQYRETDFAFVSRLMEEEGIHYYFHHAEGEHTMILSDNSGAYDSCPQSPADQSSGNLEGPHISTWDHRWEFRPGKWSQTDYSFKAPGLSLLSTEETLVEVPGVKDYEIFDYPGRFTAKDQGKGLTKVRMGEEESSFEIAEGASDLATFSPGAVVEIGRHEIDSEQGGKWVLRSVRHEASDETGLTRASEPRYGNSFSAVRHSDTVPFRPARLTPRPSIRGIQTAVVVGPSGEEIFTDEYGRIKVQFHWDRLGKKDDKASCWMRVAQGWAGKNWGIIHLPRIGQEVVVSFLEGDPDFPLVTGSVYNAEQMPPYELPGKKTQSTLKTRSTKEGSPDNFNELRFEDEKGKEQVYFHAEKNMDVVVESDKTLDVGNNETRHIKVNRATHIEGNDDMKIDGNETLEVKGTRTTKVTGDEKRTLEANRTTAITGNDTISTDGNREAKVAGSETMEVTGDQQSTVSGSRTESVHGDSVLSVDGTGKQAIGGANEYKVGGAEKYEVGGKQDISTGGNRTSNVTGNEKVEASGDITLKAGGNIVLDAGGEITIKAGSKITLECGASTIELGMAKVEMSSILASVEGKAKASFEGAMAEVKGSGKLTLEGGVVNIN